MNSELPFIAPFDPGIFAFLAARAVAGVEEADGSSYARTLALPGGHAWFRVRWTGQALLLEQELESPDDAPELLLRVRRLFNLDHDPRAADAALARDPLLAARVALLPGIRLPGSVDAAEILIRALVGQQITVAAARTALRQLAVLGTPTRRPHGSLTRLFPRPTELAAGAAAILRGPRRRIESILAVTAALAGGDLTLGPEDTPESLAQTLLPVPGIGPWTVGYVSMRVLGSPDVFLPSDAAVRNGYGLLRGESLTVARTRKPAELTAAATAWQPWRSYATLHLWRVAGEDQTRRPGESPAAAKTSD